jgi:hypothetical protein
VDVCRVRPKGRDTGAENGRLRAHSPQQHFGFVQGQTPGLRHEGFELAWIERIHIERDVDTVRPVDRFVERVRIGAQPRGGDVRDFRRVEVAGTEQDRVLGSDGPGVEDHSQRHAPEVPRGRSFRRVQVAVGVDPDEREPVVARSEALDRADVRAATAAEDQRPLGKLGRDRQRLLSERVLLDPRRLGIGQRQVRRLGDRLAALAPCARYPDEPGGELAPAGVALVARAERDSRERAAVGAPRAQAAQVRSFR